MSGAKGQCSVRVYSGARWDFSGHQCSMAAKVERDGKWYCTKHDPVRIKAKREEECRKWDARIEHEAQIRAAEAAEAAEQKRRAALYPDLLEALEAVKAWAIEVEEGDQYKARILKPQAWEKVRAAIAKATGNPSA